MFNRKNVIFFDHPDFDQVYAEHPDYSCVMRYNVNVAGGFENPIKPPKPEKPKPPRKNASTAALNEWKQAMEDYEAKLKEWKNTSSSQPPRLDIKTMKENQNEIIRNFLKSIDDVDENGTPINPQFYKVKNLIVMEDYYYKHYGEKTYHETVELPVIADYVTARLNHLAALVKKYGLAEEVYFVSYKKSAFAHINFEKNKYFQCVYLPEVGEPELITSRPTARKKNVKTE